MRDGTTTYGNPRRVSPTHVELRDGRDRTQIAIADVSHVQTRGHRLLYGALGMSALALGGVVGAIVAASRCDEDADLCQTGITVFTAIPLIAINITALALLIRGLVLRRRDLRAFYRGRPPRRIGILF